MRRLDWDMLNLVVTCIQIEIFRSSWNCMQYDYQEKIQREKYRFRRYYHRCDQLLYTTGGIAKSGGVVWGEEIGDISLCNSFIHELRRRRRAQKSIAKEEYPKKCDSEINIPLLAYLFLQGRDSVVFIILSQYSNYSGSTCKMDE